MTSLTLEWVQDRYERKLYGYVIAAMLNYDNANLKPAVMKYLEYQNLFNGGNQ